MLLNKIGNTPLIRFSGDVPNKNTIWLKLECENPFGSHYDRVYRAIFKFYEEHYGLRPGMTVLETTSGSAGVSFAAIGTALGYECLVMIPEGGEKAREYAIVEAGGILIPTPKEDYVKAFKREVVKFLAKRRREGRPVVYLNHSMGPNETENEVTTGALAEIGEELLRDLLTLDYFFAAVGNGSSILGPGRVLKGRSRIVTFEPFQSGVAFEILYPGEYERMYRITPGRLSRHRLPGMSYQGIDFPHIRIAFTEEKFVERTWLVSDSRTDEEYRERTGLSLTRDLPHWDSIELPDFGRSTRAGVAVALELAKEVENKTIVLLAYDKADRYDPCK